MGRAYEVRKRKAAKTGTAKAKLYSTYAKEIYVLAKKKGPDLNTNLELKHLIDKAKIDQVSNEVIKRALDRVNKGAEDSYNFVRYEAFGPSSATLIIDCLTDNINRTISSIRSILFKMGSKLGSPGSAIHLFDQRSVISFIDNNEDALLETLVEADIDIKEIKKDNDVITIYGNPSDLDTIKQVLIKYKKDIIFKTKMITLIPYQLVILKPKELEVFKNLLNLLDDNEDVKEVYHNIKLD